MGKCNLPGIQIDIKPPNALSELVFDSTGMKSILILPWYIINNCYKLMSIYCTKYYQSVLSFFS